MFDNAVSPDELWAFLPASGGTQVVVTSTNQTFADVGVPVEVPAYTRPESLRFLRDRTRLDASDGADAVADHPLALAQAAATIRRRRLSYLEYLARSAGCRCVTCWAPSPSTRIPRARSRCTS